jgi:TonB family protein
MMVRWDVGAPPNKGEWFDILAEALGDEAGVYWVRFYREPGGWRFDLERRRQTLERDSSFEPADEAVAQRVYALLVESGKPIDPGWRPSAPSPPAAVVRTPTRVVASEPPAVAEAAPPDEALPTVPPVPEPASPTRRKRHRKRHRPPEQQSLGQTTPPVSEAETEPVEPTPVAPVAPVAPVLEPVPPSEAPGSAPRPPPWRGPRAAIAFSSAVLLVAFAGWLYYRGGLRPSPASPPAPSPAATASQETLAAEERLKELEAVVAQLRQERAQGLPGRRPALPAPIAATPRISGREATRAAENRPDESVAPTPAPTPVATTPAVPAPPDLPVATVPVPVLIAPAEPPPTAPPVRPGALVDATDPGLTPPVFVSQPRSRYPPLAQARRLSGKVWLRALVDETGAVVDASLIRASPRGLGFEDAAMELVRRRVYRPATKQGVPVRVWLPITFEFQFSGR